jgi:predicted Holliday junction resolvase-like endonuclease
MLRPGSETGEGKLGSLIWLVVVVAVLYAGWQVIPVYVANYTFADKVVELARAPKYSHPDDRITKELIKAAQENHLEQYVNEKTCEIRTLEVRRTIACEYERTVEILPGFKHKFKFKSEADQPLI